MRRVALIPGCRSLVPKRSAVGFNSDAGRCAPTARTSGQLWVFTCLQGTQGTSFKRAKKRFLLTHPLARQMHRPSTAAASRRARTQRCSPNSPEAEPQKFFVAAPQRQRRWLMARAGATVYRHLGPGAAPQRRGPGRRSRLVLDRLSAPSTVAQIIPAPTQSNAKCGGLKFGERRKCGASHTRLPLPAPRDRAGSSRRNPPRPEFSSACGGRERVSRRPPY